MEQTRQMESSNSLLLVFGGAFAVFLNWIFNDVHWVLGGVWKGVMSLIYGGVGAYGAHFTRKYIIAKVEKFGGFWKWVKAFGKKTNHDDSETPKQ